MNDAFIQQKLVERNAHAIAELNEQRSIDLGKFLAENQGDGIPLKELSNVACSSTTLDYAFIYTVAAKYKCKNYLEIGTYIGDSINILTDICDNCYSITAPIDDSPISPVWSAKLRDMPSFAGRLCYADNVKVYYCDSKQFDWSNIDKDIDLYFIDGDHSYVGVYTDTINVFRQRKPDSIVIWHDFKEFGLQKTMTCAQAVKDALGEEWQNVYCCHNNMCGIYLPTQYQNDFSLRPCKFTEEPQDLYVYDTVLRVKNLGTGEK